MFRIPNANEIYTGSTSKIAILLNEYFGVYVQRPLYKQALKMLKWYHSILRQYNRPIPSALFDEGDLSLVWPHFQSGSEIFCVLYHFFGPSVIGTGDQAVRVDPFKVASRASCLKDFRSNLTYVFTLLRCLEIDVVWTPEDWITNPDTEFIIFQLHLIYLVLKPKQCVLPPAQGDIPGLSSGPNGEPIVAGLIFSDSKPKSSKLPLYSKKAVLLGMDKDSLPTLPIDIGAKADGTQKKRFSNALYCPLGMISTKEQISQVAIKLKEIKQEKLNSCRWNSSSTPPRKTLKERSTQADKQVLSVLKFQNKVFCQTQQTNNNSTTLQVSKTFSTELNKTGNVKLQEEIDLAINNLEKEIAISQNQLTALEEKLVERYLELDANMLSYEVHEYEEILNNLEHERIELEEEKVKLQDHFATKLSSIKQVYLPGAFPATSFASSDNDYLKQSLPMTPINSTKKKTMKNSIMIRNQFVDKEKCEKGEN